jgi:hypothetical protein
LSHTRLTCGPNLTKLGRTWKNSIMVFWVPPIVPPSQAQLTFEFDQQWWSW